MDFKKDNAWILSRAIFNAIVLTSHLKNSILR